MNPELEQKLWNIGTGEEEYSKETWYEIIDALLDDFREFIGQDFHRDAEIELTTGNPCPSFSRWIYSDERKNSPLSATFSGLLGGQIVGDEGLGGSFYVSLILFLFDNTGDKRLQLKTGESYLLFTYIKQSNGRRGWHNAGWCWDEWGQWENL